MSLQFSLQVMTQTRKKILELVEGLTIEDWNKIPQGFNNNIIWNFGHIIVTPQLLCYNNAGQKGSIPQEIVDKYRKGSKPETFVDATEIQYLKSILFSSLENLEKDRNAGILDSYNTITTSIGIVLDKVDDATAYTSSHDQLHWGYMQALKRIVKGQ